MFIFEDPKEANEFYYYVNTKFQLGDDRVYDDVPFSIQGQHYFFSFYEVNILDKAVNFSPLLFSATINAVLQDDESAIEDPEEFRKENHYIAIEVYNDIENDCLVEMHYQDRLF